MIPIKIFGVPTGGDNSDVFVIGTAEFDDTGSRSVQMMAQLPNILRDLADQLDEAIDGVATP